MKQEPKLIRVLSGRPDVLLSITTFCQAVYHRAFGTEEGERRYRLLGVEDAIALWQSGLPASRNLT